MNQPVAFDAILTAAPATRENRALPVCAFILIAAAVVCGVL